MAWGLNYSINFAMDGYKLPLNKAKEYFLTGRSFTAKELEQMGVANRVVATKADLMDAAMLLARQMCEVLPCVVTANKQVLNFGVENMGLYQTLAFARELFGLIRLNGCDASPETEAYWKECKELDRERSCKPDRKEKYTDLTRVYLFLINKAASCGSGLVYTLS